jgi:hypothetical protein
MNAKRTGGTTYKREVRKRARIDVERASNAKTDACRRQRHAVPCPGSFDGLTVAVLDDVAVTVAVGDDDAVSEDEGESDTVGDDDGDAVTLDVADTEKSISWPTRTRPPRRSSNEVSPPAPPEPEPEPEPECDAELSVLLVVLGGGESVSRRASRSYPTSIVPVVCKADTHVKRLQQLRAFQAPTAAATDPRDVHNGKREVDDGVVTLHVGRVGAASRGLLCKDRDVDLDAAGTRAHDLDAVLGDLRARAHKGG